MGDIKQRTVEANWRVLPLALPLMGFWTLGSYSVSLKTFYHVQNEWMESQMTTGFHIACSFHPMDMIS